MKRKQVDRENQSSSSLPFQLAFIHPRTMESFSHDSLCICTILREVRLAEVVRLEVAPLREVIRPMDNLERPNVLSGCQIIVSNCILWECEVEGRDVPSDTLKPPLNIEGVESWTARKRESNKGGLVHSVSTIVMFSVN